MNIFALSSDPHEAARWAIDKHVIKMVLETAQILSTVSWRYGVEAPYRPTHAQHPCTLWAGETIANWHWLLEHGLALADEYARRYGREHKSRAVIEWAALHGGRPAEGDLTPFAQAMPDQYRTEILFSRTVPTTLATRPGWLRGVNPHTHPSGGRNDAKV